MRCIIPTRLNRSSTRAKPCAILKTMRKKHPWHGFGLGVLCLLPLCLLVACATPDARIKKHQDVFDAFPPEIQEKVREGEIEIGFNEDMVFIALGKPDREYLRRTAEGELTVWSYTAHYTQTRREMIDGRFNVRDPHSGRRHTVRDSVWVDVPTYHEYDRLRVEFEDDRVVAIEELNR